jgi:hypothetical protein
MHMQYNLGAPAIPFIVFHDTHPCMHRSFDWGFLLRTSPCTLHAPPRSSLVNQKMIVFAVTAAFTALGSLAYGVDDGVRAIVACNGVPGIIAALCSSDERVVVAAARSLKLLYQVGLQDWACRMVCRTGLAGLLAGQDSCTYMPRHDCCASSVVLAALTAINARGLA